MLARRRSPPEATTLADGRRRRGRVPSGWLPCRAGRWSAPSCTASSSGPTSTRRTSPPRSATALPTEVTWRNVDLGDTDAVVAGPVRRHRVAARAARRTASACATWRAATAWTSCRSRSRSSAATTPSATPARRRRGRPARGAPARGRPGARYAPRLRDPSLGGVLRGYLTGSLDLVFRLPRRPFRRWPTTRRTGSARPTRRSRPGTTGPRRCRPRWWRRTTRSRPCSTAVALHRYLRWRLPGYEPERHLGRRPLPLRPRHERRREPHDVSTAQRPAACGPGVRRPRWSRR